MPTGLKPCFGFGFEKTRNRITKIFLVRDREIKTVTIYVYLCLSRKEALILKLNNNFKTTTRETLNNKRNFPESQNATVLAKNRDLGSKFPRDVTVGLH